MEGMQSERRPRTEDGISLQSSAPLFISLAAEFVDDGISAFGTDFSNPIVRFPLAIGPMELRMWDLLSKRLA